MSRPAPDHLPIRTICALTGVNPMTLRAWERRYALIVPRRTPTGHRLYTHHHVEQIRRVMALVERGVPISRVKEQIEDEPTTLGATAPTRGRWRDRLDRMAQACARFDEPELDRIYDEALSVHPVDQVTRLLLLPLLNLLGERWKNLPGAIAEEHFFATYLRSKLGARLQRRLHYAEGPRLLLACAPGEQHELGLLLFALEAQEAGLRTIVLGADTPLEELASAAQRARCDALVVSSSVDPEPGFVDRSLRSLVERVGVPVFFGGPTSLRHRQAIASAGAKALGTDLEDGVRLIAATLRANRNAT
jgi:DNA-binding transcriptional MerR regulator/methylmalonyl-CoA mutase cobalamin-binding subunit